MNTFLSLFRICSDKFKIKGFFALKFTRVIIPEYTLPVSCSKPNQRSSLLWAGSGKAHQCHLCRCTLITQHFHFSLVNLILRLTRVFKIFAEKCFQSIKSLAWRISRSPLESRENKIPFSFSSRKWRII